MVRIRMKRMGRTHRPFYRICAMDARAPRDGRVIEELGFYDPMVPLTDARVRLKTERVSYWLSVGAQPTPKVAVLIRKYGENGTHLEQQQAALEKLGRKAEFVPPKLPESPAEEPTPETPAEGEPAAEGAPAAESTPAAEGAESTEGQADTENKENKAEAGDAAPAEAAAEPAGDAPPADETAETQEEAAESKSE